MATVQNKDIQKSLKLIDELKYDDAIYLLKKVLRNDVKNSQALSVLGQLYISKAKYKEAIDCLEKCIKHSPNDYELIARLAYACEKNGDYQKAIDLYKKALSYDLNQFHLYDCIGRTLSKDAQDYDAIAYMYKALHHIKNDPWIHNNIAFSAKRIGAYDIALKHYEIAHQMDPATQLFLSCQIFNSFKDPNKTLKDIQSIAEDNYAKFLSKTEGQVPGDLNQRLDSTKTKLRLGFVSADICQHPVSAYLLPVLENINREQFDIYIYYAETKVDHVTESFKQLANKFEFIKSKSDQEAALMIYQDEIDLLFDMSGFTTGGRLGIFKIKPAPVQVHHIGFFGTLGMPQMDFLLADAHMIREGEDQFFTEKVYRMDTCYTHCNLNGLPEARRDLPYTKNGFVTFGSMNGFHKISTHVLNLWSSILKEIPNSKLIINAQSLKTEANKKYVLDIFANNGIDRSRLDIRSSGPREDFLKTYSEIDIALDPFPYGGGTTTTESLMMNVPVVTIDGDRWTARMSSSFLTLSKLPELIAKDQDEYFKIATDLAKDTDRLLFYRNNLRTQVISSNLNLETHINNLEKAIWEMWQIKCEEST
ncbi:MAG: tetratricopeptide repeat protein [Candidatus Caenarcaniphilales bacterium]|nr:tetratricopeptide repeat protein [Candidatus Caenarcaniphilales bacterium]